MESIFHLHQKHFALLFLKEAIWVNVMGLCLQVVVNQKDKLLFSTLILDACQDSLYWHLYSWVNLFQ
jgi:hypothetical protein